MKKIKYSVLSIFILLVLVLPLISLGVIYFNYEGVTSFINRFSSKIVSLEIQQFSVDYITSLRDADISTVVSSSVPDESFSRDNMTQLSKYFKGFDVENLTIINTVKNINNGVVSYGLTYEVVDNAQIMETPYATIEIKIVTYDERLAVLSIWAKPSQTSVQQSIQKSISDNLFKIILALCILLFIIYTAWTYIRNSPKPRWRILALILLVNIYVIISSGEFSLNVGFNSFVELSQAGIVINFWLPLGAIIFWARRKSIYLKESNLITTQVISQ